MSGFISISRLLYAIFFIPMQGVKEFTLTKFYDGHTDRQDNNNMSPPEERGGGAGDINILLLPQPTPPFPESTS